MSDELIELQTRIAFQEHALEELNTVVTRQQQQIDLLMRELHSLREQYESLHSHSAEGAEIDEKPPHY